MSRRLALMVLVCVCAAAILGCGSGTQMHQARQLEDASILANTVPLSKRLVKQAEIESTSDAAAQRTFLKLWSALQFGAWDQAETFFQPGLRNAIGPALLAQALAQEVIVWQATKPRLVTVRTEGPAAHIGFLMRDEKDGVVPASISFERASGIWRVSYFSPLDGALRRAVQLREQARINPLATTASPEAIRRGVNAATLQSRYLEGRVHAGGRAAGGTKTGP